MENLICYYNITHKKLHKFVSIFSGLLSVPTSASVSSGFPAVSAFSTLDTWNVARWASPDKNEERA